MKEEIKDNIYGGDGFTQETQTLGGFTAGPEGNVAIELMRGKVAELRGDPALAYRHVVDQNDPPRHAPAWLPSPDYCGDAELCRELLDDLGVGYSVCSAMTSKRGRTLRHVGLMEYAGEAAFTQLFAKESEALAAILFHTLENKSRMT